MLTAYYDLSVSPPTYDIVAFLSHVEGERIKRGEDKVKIVFLPGPADGFRQDKFWPFTTDGRQLMLHRVAIPMAEMLPHVIVQKEVLRRLDKPLPGSIGWGQPIYGLAIHIKALRAGIRPLVEQKVDWAPKPLVTITLREAEHWPERNSNLAEWMKAYHAIRAMGFDVVVIRDTVKSEEPLEGIATNYRASWQLNQRAILYRSAVANLGISNGPMWFAIALDAPVLMFKPTVEGLMRTCSAQYFRECGIETGGQVPGCPDYQRIVWSEDKSENIVSAFCKFMNMADAECHLA